MTAQHVACQPTDFASSTGALGQLFLQDGAMHSMFLACRFCGELRGRCHCRWISGANSPAYLVAYAMNI